jgi:hypothetical protein
MVHDVPQLQWFACAVQVLTGENLFFYSVPTVLIKVCTTRLDQEDVYCNFNTPYIIRKWAALIAWRLTTATHQPSAPKPGRTVLL